MFILSFSIQNLISSNRLGIHIKALDALDPFNGPDLIFSGEDGNGWRGGAAGPTAAGGGDHSTVAKMTVGDGPPLRHNHHNADTAKIELF